MTAFIYRKCSKELKDSKAIGDDSLSTEKTETFKILTLDGGGSKGFYSLGVLKEVEALVGCPLYEKFDLIYGTSTGAIIASLLALGESVNFIYDLYIKYIPAIMGEKKPSLRTAKLKELAKEVYGNKRFDSFKTNIGIVTTNWLTKTPKIFKANIGQAHGSVGTFVPGFGCYIRDAVAASCSAFPFFDRLTFHNLENEEFECIDGGFCANNPTLYAITDVELAFKISRENIKLLSIGTGEYVDVPPSLKLQTATCLGRIFVNKQINTNTINRILEVNVQSMDQLRRIIYGDIETVRISDSFPSKDLATNLMETDIAKLKKLHQNGRNSFSKYESEIKKIIL